jgi:hypothetical protein
MPEVNQLPKLSEQIVDEFKKLKTYKASQDAYRNIRRENPGAHSHGTLDTLTARINMIAAWLAMLPENEAYVVNRHLVDGLDWEQVVHEYNDTWGARNAREERTLVRRQTFAIRRIERFVREHACWYAGLLELDESVE